MSQSLKESIAVLQIISFYFLIANTLHLIFFFYIIPHGKKPPPNQSILIRFMNLKQDVKGLIEDLRMKYNQSYHYYYKLSLKKYRAVGILQNIFKQFGGFHLLVLQ